LLPIILLINWEEVFFCSFLCCSDSVFREYNFIWYEILDFINNLLPGITKEEEEGEEEQIEGEEGENLNEWWLIQLFII